jgi:tRNA nucleotidyltransferase (CCA-adding enzyme)
MRHTVSTRVLVPEKLEIKLTETESSICELLDQCVRFLKSEKGITTSCRVAGGWVRDKVNRISANACNKTS